MIGALPDGSHLGGDRRHLVIERSDLAVSAVALAAAAFVDSDAWATYGFQHFQAWIQTEAAGTIQLQLGAYHPTQAAAMGAGCVIGTIVAPGPGVFNTYFGTSLAVAASANGDTVRFGRLLRVRLTNTGAGPVTVSLDIEALG